MIGVNLSEALVELEAIARANEALKGKRRHRDAAREPPGIHPPAGQCLLMSPLPPNCPTASSDECQSALAPLQRRAAMEDTEVLLQSHKDNHNILPVPLFKSAFASVNSPPPPTPPPSTLFNTEGS